jgi:hypothetical protein
MYIARTYQAIKKITYTPFITGGLIIISFTLPAVASAQNGLVTCTDDCDWNDFIGMINGLVEWLIIIATSVAVLLFIYAGFLYLTSGGNDSQVKQAKTIFINVAIGFAIMLMAYLIVITIVSLLTGEEWLQKNEGYIPVDLS